MITVEEAEKIILQQVADYGTVSLPFQQALGHILAEDIVADRDIPACDRATMDGITIKYEAFQKGIRSFSIKATQSAGDVPVELQDIEGCIEIMTGAALDASVDTVIRYEDIDMSNGLAILKVKSIKQGQNVHKRGVDKNENDVIVHANSMVTPAIIGAAAFTGREAIEVKKFPKIIVISNGDELTEVSETPPLHKIRRSNSYTIKAALQQFNIDADLLHLPDDENVVEFELKKCIENYDVVILSGGVSMGKFDLVPKVLERLSVEKLFHKVQQKPGKPFWFGVHADGAKVFAFPGNPVSTFMCFYRYFVPWFKASLGLPNLKLNAGLAADFSFEPPLQYFLQVKLHLNEASQLIATPAEGHGSGDLANLVESDAFMELPLKLNNFRKGDVYPVWPFKALFI